MNGLMDKFRNRKVRMRKHPLPYIDELRDLVYIRNFDDILRINDFVYSLVPSVYPAYDQSGQFESFPELYESLRDKEIGGWCSLNTVILNRILGAYGIESSFYNYGFPENFLTHMVLLVHFNDQHYVVDPFLNKHYRDEFGLPLTFEQIILTLVYRGQDKINTVYGTSRKPATYIPDPLDRDEPKIFPQWVNFLPEVFDLKVTQSFKKAGLGELLKVFGSDNPLFLMFFPLKG